MSDLKAVAQQLSLERVATLLGSGNVVFDATPPGPEIETILETTLAAHGLQTDVMVRDLDDLLTVIADNPFATAALDHPSHLLVTFHREVFPAERVAHLAEVHRGGELLHAVGREFYTDYLGQQHMRDSKLLQSMNKARFSKIATARNWNTVGKLAAMLAT